MCSFCVRTTLHVFLKPEGERKEKIPPLILVTEPKRFFFSFSGERALSKGFFLFFLFSSDVNFCLRNSCQEEKYIEKKKSKHLSVFPTVKWSFRVDGAPFARGGFLCRRTFSLHIHHALRINFFLVFKITFEKSISVH